MRTIYKYAIPGPEILGTHGIEMHGDVVRILHFGRDSNRTLCVWVEVNPDAPLKVKKLTIFGTGQGPIPDKLVHISTCADGPYMWHLYAQSDL